MSSYVLALKIAQLRRDDLPTEVVTPFLDSPHDRFDGAYHHLLLLFGVETKGKGEHWKECRACQRLRCPEVDSFLKQHYSAIEGSSFILPSIREAVVEFPL